MTVLYYISIYSVLVPLIIGLMNISKIEVNAKLVLLTVTFASIPQLATIIYPPNKLPAFFYNGYIIVDAIMWPLVFTTSVQSLKIKRTILTLMVASVVLIITTFALSTSFSNFHPELVCVNSLLQIQYITFYFFEINAKNEYIKLGSKPIFWFCIGLLFYASCTFFMFLFYKKINSYYGKSDSNFLWGIHHFFNSFMYLVFTIGFIIKDKNYGR